MKADEFIEVMPGYEKPMDVILSVKPEFVEKILSGVKKYEYRKTSFKRPVSRVYIYSTSPVRRIVAEFKIETVLSDSPANIWEKTKDFSGIDKKHFFDYFAGREQAFALKIKDLYIYNQKYEPCEILPNFIAPQSYHYIDNIDIPEGKVQGSKMVKLNQNIQYESR